MAKCSVCEFDEELIEEIENGSIVYFCPNCGTKYDSSSDLLHNGENIVPKMENIVTKEEKKPEVVVNKKVEPPLHRKQYKVISTREGWITSEFNTSKIEAILNQYAIQGWVFKSCVNVYVPTLFNGAREEIIIILEKDL